MDWKDVISFWFNEIPPAKWFEKDAAFDDMIRERFSQTHRDVAEGKTSSWRNTPLGRLAEIVVLDQFSRNMFRGKPLSFQYDEQALLLAEEAIEQGDDQSLTPSMRYFVYMPYMHSESKEVHKKAIDLFTKLEDTSGLRYEKLHKDIIDRFGRYPARNEILGRKSTEEELSFLKEHPGF